MKERNISMSLISEDNFDPTNILYYINEYVKGQYGVSLSNYYFRKIISYVKNFDANDFIKNDFKSRYNYTVEAEELYYDKYFQIFKCFAKKAGNEEFLRYYEENMGANINNIIEDIRQTLIDNIIYFSYIITSDRILNLGKNLSKVIDIPMIATFSQEENVESYIDGLCRKIDIELKNFFTYEYVYNSISKSDIKLNIGVYKNSDDFFNKEFLSSSDRSKKFIMSLISNKKTNIE